MWSQPEVDGSSGEPEATAVADDPRNLTSWRSALGFYPRRRHWSWGTTLCAQGKWRIIRIKCNYMFIFSEINSANFRKHKRTVNDKTCWSRLHPGTRIFNTIAADARATQGARTSSVMVLKKLPQNILISAPEGRTHWGHDKCLILKDESIYGLSPLIYYLLNLNSDVPLWVLLKLNMLKSALNLTLGLQLELIRGQVIV